MAQHKARAERSATDDGWPALMGRIGIFARGVIHLLVGWLAVRIATGDGSEQANQKGAIALVVRQPLGRVLVVGLAVGFLAYAGWRLVEAALDPEDKGPVKRIGYAGRGALYVGLFGTALRAAFGSEHTQSGGSGGASQKVATGVFSLPMGRWLVVVAGVAVVAMGAWNGYRAVSRSFEKKLKKAEMSSIELTWTVRVGVVGHAARAVAYGLVGLFLVRAAVRYDPAQPVGLDAALHELARRPFGPVLLIAVGTGFAAFGVYQVVLARYREVLDS